MKNAEQQGAMAENQHSHLLSAGSCLTVAGLVQAHSRRWLLVLGFAFAGSGFWCRGAGAAELHVLCRAATRAVASTRCRSGNGWSPAWRLLAASGRAEM